MNSGFEREGLGMRMGLAAWVLLLLGSAALADDRVRMLDGNVDGEFISVNGKEIQIKQKSDGAVVTAPLESVLALEMHPLKGIAAGTAYCDVRLVDDSVLLCASCQLKGKTLEAKLLSGQTARIDLANVVSVLRDAQNAELKKQWDALISQNVKRDRIVLFQNGEFNSIEGTIAGADEDGGKVSFRPAEGDPLKVSAGKIQGMVFFREGNGTGPAPTCLVYDVTGNALAAVQVEAENGKFVVKTTMPDVKIEYPAGAVHRIDFNMGKLVYLSDMTPIKVVEKSAAGLIVTHRRDVNLDGEPIVLDTAYPKGLSMHAYTELEYDLKGKFKNFNARVGVDTRLGNESKAKLRIELDGKVKYSEVVTAKNGVTPIQIDVSKGGILRIVVSSDDLLELHDHVTIANPKVTK